MIILTNTQKSLIIDGESKISISREMLKYNKLEWVLTKKVAEMKPGQIKEQYGELLKQEIKKRENKDIEIDDIVKTIIETDPHKFNRWIVESYLRGGIVYWDELLTKVKPSLKKFAILSKKTGNPKYKDITNYYGLIEGKIQNEQKLGLEKVLQENETIFETQKQIEQKDKGYVLVYENPHVKKYKILTLEGSCAIGKNTKWCTAREDAENKYEDYKDNLYVLIPKFPKHKNEKYQYQHEGGEYKNEHNIYVDPIYMFKRFEMFDEYKDITNIKLAGVKKIPEELELKNIKRLTMENARLTDLTQFRELTNLDYLNLSVNEITDISSLENLVNLTMLDLNYNRITDISSLENLVNLTVLDLNYNRITDISSLENLVKLIYLYLNSNEITDITPLKDLVYLDALHLSNNKIEDITPLEKLVNLFNLNLSNNKIEDITPLEKLVNLEFLDISRNKISETSISQLKDSLVKLKDYIY